MLIMPKKGYRICVDCGRISLPRQLKDKKISSGKIVKCCPHCGTAENVNTARPIFNEYQARQYFMTIEYIREDSKKYFCEIPEEVIKMYDDMYDVYDIPKHLRVYQF